MRLAAEYSPRALLVAPRLGTGSAGCYTGRRPGGSYSETLYREGIIEPVALPGVRIELAALFE